MPLPALTIREANAGDIATIVAMLADDPLGQTRDDPRLPLDAAYLRAFDAIASDPNQLLVVAERGTEVIGTLQLSFLPSLSRKGAWRGQIEAVRIAAGERGSGIGRMLIGWAIDTCRSRGCALVQLTSDRSRSRAHEFYESLGFVGSHTGFKRTL
jgi:GNAT superfamily N-acetyltransferase